MYYYRLLIPICTKSDCFPSDTSFRQAFASNIGLRVIRESNTSDVVQMLQTMNIFCIVHVLELSMDSHESRNLRAATTYYFILYNYKTKYIHLL